MYTKYIIAELNGIPMAGRVEWAHENHIKMGCIDLISTQKFFEHSNNHNSYSK